MKTLESILAEHPFFKEFTPEYLQLMKGCASNAFYRAGTYIFREDEDASHFYVIRQGKVALEISAGSLGMITIETLDADEVLGWSWLFPRTAGILVPVLSSRRVSPCLMGSVCERNAMRITI